MAEDQLRDIYEVMNTQRAIRQFKPDPVPEEVIRRIIDAATKAPSGSNRQPWGFVVVRDGEKRKAIAEALREAVLSPGGFGNPDEIEDPVRRRMIRGANELFGNFAAAPVFIIPCLVSAQDSPAPRGLLSGSSIYPSVQNLLLAARAEGLGTVMTTPQAGIVDTLRAELGIPDHARPVAMIPLGYPAVRFGPVDRRPVDEFIHWDGWSG